MKMKTAGFIAAALSIFMMICTGGCAMDPEGALEDMKETALPSAQWQLDVTFPDWKGTPHSSLAINNRIGFYSYKGQGKLYLCCDEDCESFSLYLNGKRVNTEKLTAGKTWLADISDLSVNGRNSIQISDLKKGTVRVCVPYPEVMEGTIEDAGIDSEAIDLIDRIITADAANGFPSAQLAIVKDGRLVYEKSWGNVKTYDEHGNPVSAPSVTDETLYDLASNTKMYSVNYAIQYLLTQEKISLDTKIDEILGKEFSEDTIHIAYEGYEDVPLETNRKWKSELTLRDLLKHQAGFPPGPHYYNDRYDCASQYYDSDNGNVLYSGSDGSEDTRKETLKQICRTPLMYEPGTQTIYSDVDYMILCYCVEKITGMSMHDFLSETFWKPMGLEHITYNPLEHGFEKAACAATELMGHTRDGALHYTGIRTDTIQGTVHDPNAYYAMAGISGHAGLFASASDLAKLASVMLTGGYGEHRFFSQNVIDMFTAPKSEDVPYYGLGWWRQADHDFDRYFGSLASPDTFGHQGFTGTVTMIDPEQNLVIVLLTNRIHSKILEGDETLSAWGGNYYTTSTAGFIPEIIEISLENGTPDKKIWNSLLSDMISDAERRLQSAGITDPDHPQMKAYQALLSLND